MTVFFTTHAMEEAEALCERVAIIDKGKIVAEGSSEKLMEQYPRRVFHAKNLTEAAVKILGQNDFLD